MIVGNEPNLSTFWKPQFGAGGRDLAARAYVDLLARSYDAIKAAGPSVRVLGGALSPRGADRPDGSRPTHSPTAFIRDLGAAYRASGRRPPADGRVRLPPVHGGLARTRRRAAHPKNTTITVADYPKLVALLDEAFQRHRAAGRATCRSTTPSSASRRGCRRRSAASTPTSTRRRAADSVRFGVQAAYYRRALELAYCQPTVRGLFVFHTFDEPGLGGWQSGLYFADRTPKPSLPAFKRAVADLRNGRLPPCRSLGVSAVAGQYVAYTFFRVDPAWRRLPIDERGAGKDAFAEAVEEFAGRMASLRAYSV